MRAEIITDPPSATIISQRELWREAFFESETFLDLFFNEYYQAKRTHLWFEDSKIKAMTTLIPTALVAPTGEKYKTSMQWAIATFPAYRSQGIASKLIDALNTDLSRRGYTAALLVPQDEGLFEFYKKSGYTHFFPHREVILPAEPSLNASSNNPEKISAAEYATCREELLRGRSHLCYENTEMLFQEALSEFTGGGLYRLRSGNEYAIFAAEGRESYLLIKEFLAPEGRYAFFASELRCALPRIQMMLRAPIWAELGGEEKHFGMIKYLQAGPEEFATDSYLGLAFD